MIVLAFPTSLVWAIGPCHSADVTQCTDLAMDWLLDRVGPDGTRTRIRAWVAKARFDAEPYPAWRSACCVEGWIPVIDPVPGATGLQALALATELVRDALQDLATRETLIDVATGQTVPPESLTRETH